MIQGIGNNSVSAESLRMAYGHQNKDIGKVGDSGTKKSSLKDDVVISGNVHEQEDADKDKMVNAVKDEYRKLQANMVRSILKNSGIDFGGKIKLNGEEIDWNSIDLDSLLTEEQKNISPEQLVNMLPDEWKPDAVAERIVNFAVAFYEKSGLSGEEFYTKIKEAIDSGFAGADKTINGKLPSNIKEVVEFTRQAVYDKLEKWAEATGIQIPYTGEDKVS